MQCNQHCHWQGQREKMAKTAHHSLYSTHTSLAEKQISGARDKFNPEGIIFIKYISKWWGLTTIPKIVQIDRGLADDKVKRYNALSERVFIIISSVYKMWKVLRYAYWGSRRKKYFLVLCESLGGNIFNVKMNILITFMTGNVAKCIKSLKNCYYL